VVAPKSATEYVPETLIPGPAEAWLATPSATVVRADATTSAGVDTLGRLGKYGPRLAPFERLVALDDVVLGEGNPLRKRPPVVDGISKHLQLNGRAGGTRGRSFTCKGRTRQTAGPPPAIAALRVLQVRPEDVAEDAEAAQEIGMWPM
jgi:hypothetical protein